MLPVEYEYKLRNGQTNNNNVDLLFFGFDYTI